MWSLPGFHDGSLSDVTWSDVRVNSDSLASWAAPRPALCLDALIASWSCASGAASSSFCFSMLLLYAEVVAAVAVWAAVAVAATGAGAGAVSMGTAAA